MTCHTRREKKTIEQRIKKEKEKKERRKRKMCVSFS